jgi:hypothetical protein
LTRTARPAPDRCDPEASPAQGGRQACNGRPLGSVEVTAPAAEVVKVLEQLDQPTRLVEVQVLVAATAPQDGTRATAK